MAALVRLDPGTVFARDFRVVRPLSEGGMGAVYVVEQLSTGKQRALKIMLPQLVADAKARERFMQEARIGGQIKGDHVVQVVGAGIDDASQTPWLAMELLEGEDLAATMRRRGALPASEVLEIDQQICDALGQAHALGIVHRDLKPENLFVEVSRRRGVPFTIKVLDFGIAKLVQENKTAATVTSAIGSPFWMAPEQAQRGAKVRPATDVWALGLITFHLLTGRYYWLNANGPAEEFNLSALIVEVMSEPIERASARAAAVGSARQLPPGFDEWFARCVDRSPTSRTANATEAAAALAPILSGGAWVFPATRPVVPPTMPSHPPTQLASTISMPSVQAVPAPRPASRGWVVPAAIGGAVLVAGGAIALTLRATSGNNVESVRPAVAQSSASSTAVPAGSEPAPVAQRPVAPTVDVPPSGPAPSPEPPTHGHGVRESTTVTLAGGVVETWRVVWISTPTPFCADMDIVNDRASWECQGFYFSEQGSAAIVRERDGMIVERYPLDPLFRRGEGSVPGQPTIARWDVTEEDLTALRTIPVGADPTSHFAGRPMARVLSLGDYDGDGVAAEFPIIVGTSSSGHRYTVLVGLSSAGRLRVYGNHGRRTDPVALAYPSQWEALRGGRGARLVQWECGNHGAEQEEMLVVHWERGELVTAPENHACP